MDYIGLVLFMALVIAITVFDVGQDIALNQAAKQCASVGAFDAGARWISCGEPLESKR